MRTLSATFGVRLIFSDFDLFKVSRRSYLVLFLIIVSPCPRRASSVIYTVHTL